MAIFARPRLPPGRAPVPYGSRPATAEECAQLLRLARGDQLWRLQCAAGREKARRLAGNLARNSYLLDLYAGVSRVHLAALLGSSASVVEKMIRAAAAATGRPAAWTYGRYLRPKPPPTSPTRRYPLLGELAPAEREPITAVGPRYRSTLRGHRHGAAETLLSILEPYRRRGISVQQLANRAALPVWQLRRALHLGAPARRRYHPPRTNSPTPARTGGDTVGPLDWAPHVGIHVAQWRVPVARDRAGCRNHRGLLSACR